MLQVLLENSTGLLVIAGLTALWGVGKVHLVPRMRLAREIQERDRWRNAVRCAEQEVEEGSNMFSAAVEQAFTPDPMHFESKSTQDRWAIQWKQDEALALSILRFPPGPKKMPACTHPAAIDVAISTGEVVAQICTVCQEQITSKAWDVQAYAPPTHFTLTPTPEDSHVS